MIKDYKKVKTRKDFANLLQIPVRKLTYILYEKKVDNLYISFEIPKKSNGTRQISAPVNELKDIQKKLAHLLWEHESKFTHELGIKHNISHAFEKGKSIITNGKIHRNKRFVLNMDLEDFFGSIHFGRVKGFFQKNRHFQFSEQVAVMIAQLACYKKKLPQGAPTSPIISNLICGILDQRLLKISRKYKMDYSRYADDLTFSTNNRKFIDIKDAFYDEVFQEISASGFRVKESKTRLSYKDSRQEVTGLTVNKKINVEKNFYKDTRAMAHSLYTSHDFKINDVQGSLNQLEGRFAFINSVDHENNKLDREKHNLQNLNSREKQYQKFLFYKYFFGNRKPLIVTEGKTDIKYLKAAMKNLSSEYPNLIVKREDGSFDFKVTFLRKSKRLKYFFNIEQDGADMMKKIYNLFSDKENNFFPNYFDLFSNGYGIAPLNPVFLLFDHETMNNKPLRIFLNYIGNGKANQAIKEEFSDKCFKNIIGNLYLITNPLVNGMDECEIEDLFDEHTLNCKIRGKVFNRGKDFSPDKHFGKEIFSQYIQNNYERINFQKFRPILDQLSLVYSWYSE